MFDTRGAWSTGGGHHGGTPGRLGTLGVAATQAPAPQAHCTASGEVAGPQGTVGPGNLTHPLGAGPQEPSPQGSGPQEPGDADRDALDHLAGMAPGAELADVVERLVAGLLVPAARKASPDPCSTEDPCSTDAVVAPGALGPDLVDPGERSLLQAAGARGVRVSDPSAIDRLAALGAETLSELVAACGRLASWAHWAQAVMSTCLASCPELRVGPAPCGPGGQELRFVTAEENRFNTSSEIACRLGVSRTRATRLLEQGDALTSATFAPTERLHRVGLLDEAKTAIIVRRLAGADAGVASKVQSEVLERAPHRTHAQLTRDLDRSLTTHDPDGASLRRRRNVGQRHVSRPRAAGEGVMEMRALMPSADAFLLDATLDAVAASARSAGDERSLSQLRADTLVAMSLQTLQVSQEQACGALPEHVTALAAAPGETSMTTSHATTSGSDATRTRLTPDGVPLEGMVTALSGLVSSTEPWWMPSGTAPVPLPPGLQVSVDVTVPLDYLADLLDASPPGTAPHGTVPPGTAPPGKAPPGTAPSGTGHPAPHHPAAGRPGTRHPGTSPSASPPEAVLTLGHRSTPVPACTARALAAGGTWRRIVTDPLGKTVLDVGRSRYRPPAAMRDLVRARDRMCTHPGCEVPARACDLDHITPWSEGGTTSLANLTSLCESHHRLKHTPGWSLTRTEDGALTWRTPTGARYRREPDGSIIMLPRRIGPRSVLLPGRHVPGPLADAVTAAVLERLEKGLAQSTSTPPVLSTWGPQPGERAGDFEPAPYPEALHALGLAPLLDAVPPF